MWRAKRRNQGAQGKNPQGIEKTNRRDILKEVNVYSDCKVWEIEANWEGKLTSKRCL